MRITEHRIALPEDNDLPVLEKKGRWSRIPVIVKGIRYRSIYMAAKELGVNKSTVNRMLRDGEASKA
jgi:hypothetical protein